MFSLRDMMHKTIATNSVLAIPEVNTVIIQSVFIKTAIIHMPVPGLHFALVVPEVKTQ